MKNIVIDIYLSFFLCFLSVNALTVNANSTSITIDITDNTIANCKIDGKTDDYSALTQIMNYVNSTSIPTIVYFPYTGSTMQLSDTIFVSRSNVTLKINCDIQFTKKVYSKTSSMNVFEIGYSAYSRNPIYNIQIIGNDIEINGNGANLSFTETTHTKPSFGDIIHFRRVIDGYISGITCNYAVENGMRIYMSQNILVERCHFTNTKLDNGLTVMGLPIYTQDWVYNDDTCNNNVIIRNCTASNNTDVGFSASVCRKVLFDTCTASENGTSNGFNAGGGFSHECLGFSTYYDTPNTWNGLTAFYNCTAFNNQNYGIYTDANGTIIDSCTINYVNQNDNSTYGRNLRGGNGIYAMGTKGTITVKDSTIYNTDSYGIAFSSGSSTIISTLDISNLIVRNTAKGIYCYNTDYILMDTVTLENIATTPLYFLDGKTKKYISLKNFSTKNIGKLHINNANNIILDNSICY